MLYGKEKTHMVTISNEERFHESKIPTKARLIQMNKETLEYCKKKSKVF